MTNPPIPLSPDDEPASPVQLRPDTAPSLPYGWFAVGIGLVALLILRGFFPLLVWWLLIDLSLVVSFTSYFLFLLLQPRVSLRWVTVGAAELGVLYSVPALWLYGRSMIGAIAVLPWVVGGGIAGLLIAEALHVERQPRPVLAIAFLALFVVTHLQYFFR